MYVWMLLAAIGLGLGFCGLWLWMQKQLGGYQKQMQESFKALSFDVLQQASTHLEQSQQGRHQAIESTLKKLDDHQRELEKRREGAYVALHQQLEQMMASDRELRKETAQLSSALRSSQMRGAWGQVHLRRVVELAGLVNHCDFAEQVTVETTGTVLRPDLVVRLPGQRHIVVDAKTPLNAYLEAFESNDEERRKAKMQDHALMLRKHIRELSSKEYWSRTSL